MASTAQGRRLTEAHRQDQIAVRSSFLVQFLELWPLLDWGRLDDTSPGWIAAVLRLIQSFRQESADLAQNYYRDYRLVEVPRAVEPAPVVEFVAPVEPVFGPRRLADGRNARSASPVEPARTTPAPSSAVRIADGPRSDRPAATESREDDDGLVKPVIDWSEWDKAAERSLAVTGPVELKRQAARAVPEGRARRVALVTSSAAAGRHVLNGGRDTALTLVSNDERAIGWARVTDGDPCSFCALLASRGPAYKTEASASFRPHDGCACGVEPVYSRSAAWPGDARAYQRLYYQATRGYSGQDAINAFRRAYEAQRRERGLARPISA